MKINKNKILIITVFLVASTSLIPSISAKSTTLIDNDDLISSSADGEKWCLIIDVFDDESETWGEGYGIVLEKILQLGGWKEENIFRLNGDDVTKSSISNKFDILKNKVSPNDTVFIYIDSHGSVDPLLGGFFFLHDHETPVFYSFIDSQLKKLGDVKGIGALIFACYSGSAIPALQGKNRIILTACKEDETAGEYFSLNLNSALSGFADLEGDFDGIISLEEIYHYLNMDVILNYHNTNYRIHPMLSDNYDGEFEFVLYDKAFVDYKNIDIYHIHPLGDAIEQQFNSLSAQSFKPYSTTLKKIKLFLWIYKDFDFSFRISIRDNLDGEDIAFVDITRNSLEDIDLFYFGRFIDIIFPETIQLDPSKTYYIVYNSTNVPELSSIGIGTDACRSINNDRYIDGKIYEYDDSLDCWEEDKGYNYVEHERQPSNKNWVFITYGEETTNNKPDKPTIEGPSNSKAGEECEYILSTFDSDDKYVYYWVNWGDTNIEWVSPSNVSENVKVNHTWGKKGSYNIRVKAIDIHGGESEDTFKIVIEKSNKAISKPFNRILERCNLPSPIIRTLNRIFSLLKI